MTESPSTPKGTRSNKGLRGWLDEVQAMPQHTLEAVRLMYGDRCLAEVRHGKRFPWVVNHRTDSLLFKLGLIEG